MLFDMETSAAVSTNTCSCCWAVVALSTMDIKPWFGVMAVNDPSLFRVKYCGFGGLVLGLGVVVCVLCFLSMDMMYLHSSVV